ncbi:MAG: hypothetical protein MI975_10870 [Cytophagales bacterium]|nr:hypothetical protein [Cytophagales bacterium]
MNGVLRHTLKATFFLIFLSFTLDAQTGKEAKICLKNGVKIKGAIVKTFDEDKLVVDVFGTGNVPVRYDQIAKIRFKNYGRIHGDIKRGLENPPVLKIGSYFHEIRGSLLFGEENIGAALNAINGYQFNKYLGTGLGIGINKYGNYLTLPVYAQVKGYIFDKKVSPYYFGDIGYGYAWNNNKHDDVFELENVKGGVYWQVGLGYQINFYNSALTLSLGYVSQDSRADYVYYRPWDIDDVEVSERRVLRRVACSVGLLF